MRKRPLLGILILIVGFISASRQVAAQDLVISRTLVEDPSGTLTIGDVLSRTGIEIGPDWNVGSSDWIYWVRLRVHAPKHGSKIVLFIRPSYLNEVRLFEPDSSSPSGWKTRVTGNLFPYADRDRGKYPPAVGYQTKGLDNKARNKGA